MLKSDLIFRIFARRDLRGDTSAINNADELRRLRRMTIAELRELSRLEREKQGERQ